MHRRGRWHGGEVCKGRNRTHTERRGEARPKSRPVRGRDEELKVKRKQNKQCRQEESNTNNISIYKPHHDLFLSIWKQKQSRVNDPPCTKVSNNPTPAQHRAADTTIPGAAAHFKPPETRRSYVAARRRRFPSACRGKNYHWQR